MIQAKDIEEAVLGAILIDNTIHHSVLPILIPEVFYTKEHMEVFRSMKELYLNHDKVDTLTVVQRLHGKGVLEEMGGSYWVNSLTYSVSSGANVETHMMVLIEKWMRRELISLSHRQIRQASDEGEDILTTIHDLQTEIMTLLRFIQSGSSTHISKIIDRVFKNAIHIQENPQKLIGIPSGFTELDRMTNGFKEPDLVVVAARPAMGKTALVVNIARNASELGYPVGIFSLEMSGDQLTERILAMYSGVQTGDLERGNFKRELLTSHVSKIGTLPIYINDKASITSLQILTATRKLVVEHGVKMIFIDYIQLIGDHGKNMNREQTVSQISRNLKMIAKDLKIPVVALSQLSRAVESRSDKRPMLSDLRESGAIEQDADRVMFLYRPDYYGTTEEDGENVIGKTELNIAKHRGGAVGRVDLRFIPETTTFESWDSYQPTESFTKF